MTETLKTRIQLVLIILLVLVAGSLLASRNASPDLPPLFALKRVQENVFMKFKSTPQARVDYMSRLLETRLKELQDVVKNKNYDFVLRASLRYSSTAGQITDLIVESNLTDKVEEIKEQFLNHQKLLDELYVAYPKNIPDNVEWKYIQDDFNYLTLYLDKLDQVK